MIFGTEVDPFVIGVVGAAIPVALGAWFVRRKTKAETTDIITEAAGRLVKDLERRIFDLETRLQKAEDRELLALRRIAELTAEISVLRKQVGESSGPHPVVTTTVTSSVTKEEPA